MNFLRADPGSFRDPGWRVYLVDDRVFRPVNAPAVEDLDFVQKSGAGLPRNSYRHMLQKLRAWIEKLNPADTGKTTWHDYAVDNSYHADEAVIKRRFITEFVSTFFQH